MPDSMKANVTPDCVLVISSGPEGTPELLAESREWKGSTTERHDSNCVPKTEIVFVSDELGRESAIETMRQVCDAVPVDSHPIVFVGVLARHQGELRLQRESRSGLVLTGAPDADREFVEAIVKRILDTVKSQSSDSKTEDAARIKHRDLCLDRAKHRVTVGDRSIHLTRTEFRLLWELASRPGYVFSRGELARFCRRAAGQIQSRTIDAHVKAIRRKLGVRPDLIETVRGVGYRFAEEER